MEFVRRGQTLLVAIPGSGCRSAFWSVFLPELASKHDH